MDAICGAKWIALSALLLLATVDCRDLIRRDAGETPEGENVNGGVNYIDTDEVVFRDLITYPKLDPRTGIPKGLINGHGKEPSRCVWAIISCCKPGSLDIRYSCFEMLGCEGAFWDNPCTKDITKAALKATLKYYSG